MRAPRMSHKPGSPAPVPPSASPGPSTSPRSSSAIASFSMPRHRRRSGPSRTTSSGADLLAHSYLPPPSWPAEVDPRPTTLPRTTHGPRRRLPYARSRQAPRPRCSAGRSSRQKSNTVPQAGRARAARPRHLLGRQSSVGHHRGIGPLAQRPLGQRQPASRVARRSSRRSARQMGRPLSTRATPTWRTFASGP